MGMTTTIDGSAGITTNAGGSVNPSTNVDGINYSCRAWVNFNGTGTVAIRSSGNVSSITDNGVGDYTVNFTTAMTDINYSYNVSGGASSASGCFTTINTSGGTGTEVAPTTSAARFSTTYNITSGSTADYKYINFALFR